MATPEQLFLQFSAISDVGRIRKDNQDSGYAGPWLLTVCDGVGGAARGDLASATAVQALRKLDTRPSDDMLSQVAGAIHRANDRISEIIDDDYVSTRHAGVAASGDEWFVEDLGSTNGTYVGSVRITQPTTIGLGIQVRIGKTILELRK